MSGDVQPRRRKDKKKRREDESSIGVHPTKMGSDDVHLHIQQDHGTGGHWCAKIFFFSLLTILFGIVGLIILENRGLADLDTPLSESRFSNYFDGWVDENRQDHDDHDPVQASLEEHDEPFEEEEDHSELDEEADEEHDDDDEDDGDNEDHNTDHNEDEDEDATAEKTEEVAEEEKENDENDEENDDNDENVTKEETNEENENDDEENGDDYNEEQEEAEDNDADVTKEATTKEEDDDDNDGDGDGDSKNYNDNDGDDEDEMGENEDEENNTQENKAETEEINGDNDADDVDADESLNGNNNDEDEDDDEDGNDAEDDYNNASVEPIYERSKQQTTTASQQSQANNDDAFDEEDDFDDGFDSIENVVDNDAEELLLLKEKARLQSAEAAKNRPASAENVADGEDDGTSTETKQQSWASSIAVKIGVGVALAIVARLVLIRNNPNTNAEPSAEVIMKRRLTIAAEDDADVGADEAEPPLPEDEGEEYSEEEIEIEEEYEYEEDMDNEDDDDDKLSAMAGGYIPETFEQLNALYRSHLSEPEPAAPPQRVESVREQRNRPAAIFNAPPPPPTSQLQQTQSTKKVSPYTITSPATTTTTTTKQTTSTNKTPAPTPTTSNTIRNTKAGQINRIQNSPKSAKQYITDTSHTPKKHEVTYDVDYRPDEEHIDFDVDNEYDDDGSDNDESVGEAEEEDEDEDEDIDDDLLDEEDVSDVDDTELMKRLEAKYGRLPPAKEYESDEDPDDPTWTQIKPKEVVAGGGGPKAHDDDQLDSFERELRRANEEMMRENYEVAIKLFNQLAHRHPNQPQAILGQALALDELAERQRSNQLLNLALHAYKRYLALGDIITDNVEYRAAAKSCIERMRFMGYHSQTVAIHQLLIQRFPNEPNTRNELAITYLLHNRLSEAKRVLQDILHRWPNDGLALVHYGFVLRQLDKDYENASIYLRRGIATQAAGTQDGRFYFNLGDSLQRLGRQTEALEVYKRGAELRLFPSVYQRSLYNEPNLRAQPLWAKAETTYENYLNELETNWQFIRDEALKLLNRGGGDFLDEAESLRDTGNWQQFELYARGQRIAQNCRKAPLTCGLIEKFSAASSCSRGQVKFSVLQPGTHVHAHCGPTNCRLRAHLGLVVPQGALLRVANEERTWTEGEFLIFDDSFEHEVWHNGTSFRLVLIVDVWHPDLSAHQRRTLTPI